MSTKETLTYLQQFYDDNMWLKERDRINLEEYILKENITVDQLRHIFETNPRVEKSKRQLRRQLTKCVRYGEHYYCVQDLFYKVGTESEICIHSRYRNERITGKYKIIVVPYYEYDYRCFEEYKPDIFYVTASDNRISFSYTFDHEDKYIFYVYYIDGDEEIGFFETYVYALEEDLYGKNYYKADLHMHTTYSDGIEPPELVAASARAAGMDIIAVTDHNCFMGSVMAKKRAEEMGLDLTVILGEEYAFPFSPMHILALGTDEEVSREFLSCDMAETDAAKEIIDKAGDSLTCDPTAYALTQLILDEVRRKDGISILAHPYWRPVFTDGSRKDTPESLFIELGKDKRFDGVELVSGSPEGEYKTSKMQTSFARVFLNNDMDVPVIGITDSHNYSTDPISGKHFTIVIADSKEKEDVLKALRERNTAAVEMIGDQPMIYGSHRLIKFGDFLVQHYFPDRDRNARQEARMIMDKFLLY